MDKERKEANKEKDRSKFPDYARKDLVGLYYSQMKIWQGLAFILAIAVVGMIYLYHQKKPLYFYSDKLNIIPLEAVDVRAEGFIYNALRDIFTIRYDNFDTDLGKAYKYMAKETADKFIESYRIMKGEFLEGRVIWVAGVRNIIVDKDNSFSAIVDIKIINIVMKSEIIKTYEVSGKLEKGEPSKENPFPFVISKIKITEARI
ncbi:MAG: hypothetical protein QXX95_03000 [Nitrososphaerales archaeon]